MPAVSDDRWRPEKRKSFGDDEAELETNSRDLPYTENYEFTNILHR